MQERNKQEKKCIDNRKKVRKGRRASITCNRVIIREEREGVGGVG